MHAHFYNYGAKGGRMALYLRDPKTGAVAFKRRLEETTGRAMVRIQGVAYAPGGRVGYFISGAESAGNAVGWFTRDPKTGALRFGGIVKQTRRSGPDSIFLDRRHHALYAGAWRSQCLFVMRTAAPAKPAPPDKARQSAPK